MGSDYLWDGSGTPDPEIRRLENLLGRLRYRSVDVMVSKWRSPKRLVPLALAASILLAIGLTRDANHAPGVSWNYQVLAGTPTIAAVQTPSSGILNAGDWLETDDNARVMLTLGAFGAVEVEPNTRIGSVTGSTPGHLVLTRGTVHALAAGSPSQFAIETPTATAYDTEGDYVLTVDDSGGAILCVSEGWVTFSSDGRPSSVVPAGAVCETRPGIGAGTPRCENGPDHFRIALERYDFVAQGAEALSGVLHESGPCDLLPLWHILGRVDSSDRAKVYDRMATFSAPPEGVTRDGILGLDPAMMQFWWSEISSNRACQLCADSYEPPIS
jgi:hypothetical protein